MNKETILHNIAMLSTKAYIDSNMPEYVNSSDGFSKMVSDCTSKYIEAYNQAEKELPKPEHKNMVLSNKPFIKM